MYYPLIFSADPLSVLVYELLNSLEIFYLLPGTVTEFDPFLLLVGRILELNLAGPSCYDTLASGEDFLPNNTFKKRALSSGLGSNDNNLWKLQLVLEVSLVQYILEEYKMD